MKDLSTYRHILLDIDNTDFFNSQNKWFTEDVDLLASTIGSDPVAFDAYQNCFTAQQSDEEFFLDADFTNNVQTQILK